MESLLVLLVVVGLAIPVLIIVLLVGQSNLKGRLDRVERALRETRATVATLTQAASAESDTGQVTPQKAPIAAKAATPPVKVASLDAVVERPISKVVSPFDLEKSDIADLAARAQAQVQAASDDQNCPLVMRPDRVGALVKWLVANWVYAVSALSLALAGIFFVQYGMEKGLLPPGLRVTFALLFGAGLIGGGEWLRRKHGDGIDKTTAYLPSVFAGAGIVTMFAAILAARQLYGLIGPELAFVGHVAVAVLAIGLGWIYGPLLVAVGLLGAALAPFIVAGGSDAEEIGRAHV